MATLISNLAGGVPPVAPFHVPPVAAHQYPHPSTSLSQLDPEFGRSFITEHSVLSPVLKIVEAAERGDEDAFKGLEDFGGGKDVTVNDSRDSSKTPVVLLQERRPKRQTTNERPVNIFGLGFGTDQRPAGHHGPPALIGEQTVDKSHEKGPSRPVSNENANFGPLNLLNLGQAPSQSSVNTQQSNSDEVQQHQQGDDDGQLGVDPDADLPDGEDGSVAEERKKRQTTNGRPVNIFGLGFGTNQQPSEGEGPVDFLQPPLSNSDVTFDESNLDSLLEDAMRDVANSAVEQSQASPEEIIKAVDSMDMNGEKPKPDDSKGDEMKKGLEGKTEGAETKTNEATEKKPTPTRKIVTGYPDLIFHPDVTDVLMLLLGIVFFFQIIPGLIGFLANFVPLENLPILRLPRPTLQG